jgi:tRNA1Val (adenine37-N6)-methyltransferase
MNIPALTPKAAQFPRGLIQPEGSFRFSSDALLLIDFAAQDNFGTLADLGTGCGVIALGLLLKFPDATGIGIEQSKDLLDTAEANAVALGINRLEAQRLRLVGGDVGNADLLKQLGRNYDLVTANPPWRILGDGRLPPNELRRKALFGAPDIFLIFAKAAACLLKPKGRFCSVVNAPRLPDLLEAIKISGLSPHRLRLTHSDKNSPASFAFVEALSGKTSELKIEPPLFTHTA